MKHHNLTVIGTSHIAKQSLEEVKKAIEEEKPEIVALELDRPRLSGLLSGQKAKPRVSDIGRIGLKGWLFMIIAGYIERKLGKVVKVKPGEEMMLAYKLAHERKAKVALIDQDISITLKNMSKAFTWKEKWNILVDLLKGTFSKKERIKFDLTKVPSQELIDRMIKKVKARYPSLYKVLIDDRNKVMAKNLHALMQRFPEQKIVAVVGAGHEKEIISLIKKVEKGEELYF